MRVSVLATALAAIIAACAPSLAEMPGLKREATPVSAPGVPNFWRIAPNLYRSGQPDAQGFVAARGLGVTTVVSLREDFADQHFGARGLKLVNTPLYATDLPDGEAQIVRALRAIRTARRHRAVLVHCQYGSDRTGAVVALYRMIYQGWSRQRAMTEMIDGPFEFHNIFIFAPPGRSIIDYVRTVDLAAMRRKIGAN